jgi:hypothetical protein
MFPPWRWCARFSFGGSGRQCRLLEVIFFRNRCDHVHYIRHAAGTFTFLAEFPVNLCWDYDFPRIIAKKRKDDFPYLLIADDVALTNKHGFRGC